MKNCKYCESKAELKGYRNIDGNVSSEFVCKTCHNLPLDILLLRKYDSFQEGDDYYALEKLENGWWISQSCWDDESEQLPLDNNFSTMEDAVKFASALGIKELRLSYFNMNKDRSIEVADYSIVKEKVIKAEAEALVEDYLNGNKSELEDMVDFNLGEDMDRDVLSDMYDTYFGKKLYII